MQRQAVAEMLRLLPDQAQGFAGSQYSAPVRTTFLGDREVDIRGLRAELQAKQDGDVKDLLQPLLLGAELVEAAQSDNARFFITDRAAQSFVFMGSKWRAGWALVLGGADQRELIAQLQARQLHGVHRPARRSRHGAYRQPRHRAHLFLAADGALRPDLGTHCARRRP